MTLRDHALSVQSKGYCHDKAALVIGEAIRSTREAMGISAASLAAAVEVSVLTVHSWERGRATPSITNLVRVAQALGVRVSSLMEGVE